MNVLILSAFPDNKKYNSIFEDFLKQIRKLLKKQADIAGVDKIEYFIRDFKTIDEFLSIGDPNNTYARKMFDSLDFIFLDGIETYLPWKNQGKKFSNFLRMCKVTNKAVFACGVGMQILVFFLATNFANDINIINANSEMESIEEIHKIPNNIIQNLKKSDYFLDYVTGDIFEYRKHSKDWDPLMNLGLHKKKVAEKFMGRGKYMLNQKTLRPNSVSGKIPQKSSTLNTEIKTDLVKNNLSHWLLKDVPNHFVVMSTLSWFSHNISLQNSNLEYKVLADGDPGCMIIEHGNYIGMSFHFNSKYEECTTLLNNFIRRKLNNDESGVPKLKLGQINDTDLALGCKLKEDISKGLGADFDMEAAKDTKARPSTSFLALSSNLYSKETHAKRMASHCGMQFNRKNKIYVDINSVNTRPVTSLHPLTASNRETACNTPLTTFMSSTTRAKTPKEQIIARLTTPTHISHRRHGITDKSQGGSPRAGGSPRVGGSPRNSRAGVGSPYRSYKKGEHPINSGNNNNDVMNHNNPNNENFFGDSGNLFYNGDIKSLKLIGPPSKNNRIAKIISDKAPNKYTMPPTKNMTLEELYSVTQNNNNIDCKKDNGGYLNFIDKGKMEEDKLFEFIKNKKIEINLQLADVNNKEKEFKAGFSDKLKPNSPNKNFVNSNKMLLKSKGSPIRGSRSPIHKRKMSQLETQSSISNHPIVCNQSVTHERVPSMQVKTSLKIDSNNEGYINNFISNIVPDRHRFSEQSHHFENVAGIDKVNLDPTAIKQKYKNKVFNRNDPQYKTFTKNQLDTQEKRINWVNSKDFTFTKSPKFFSTVPYKINNQSGDFGGFSPKRNRDAYKNKWIINPNPYVN